MMRYYLTLGLVAILLSGCVSQTVKTTSIPALNRPESAVAERELLDVGIVVFDPGLDQASEDNPIYPEVRRAEASFMARELSNTLANQGAWGAVRVVPDNRQFTDLSVQGRIEHSDGERLSLQVTVSDARGVTWIDKQYDAVTSRYAYKTSAPLAGDPFLALYRDIANDMLRVFMNLPAQERVTIRRVAELQFARNFAEDAFADYLDTKDDGTTRLRRLPADDDPMLERVRAIRQRNYVFVDTLQGYYTGFSEEMYTPYQEWRRLSYDEVVALRELRRQANTQMFVGGVALAAGILGRTSSNDYAQVAGMVGILGGGMLARSGLEKRAEANIHELAIEELGQSLEAEITPRVIELDDRTVRLSGSVQDQYDQWRELLADIYAAEISALEGPPSSTTMDANVPETGDAASENSASR